MPTTSLIEKEILFDVLNNPGDAFYENVLSDFLDEQGIEHDFRKPLHDNNIKELKPYQEKCLDIWAKHWIDISLCAKSTDESKAEQYFYDLHKQFGVSKPKSIIWFDNPFKMCFEANDQENNLNLELYLLQAWNQIRNQVRSRVWNQVWDQVRSQVWNYIWDKLLSQARRQVERHWHQLQYGQYDASWFAFYAYMMQVLRSKAPKDIVPLMLLAQQVNCWFPTKEAVYVTRKPKECIVKDGKLAKVIYQGSYTVE